MNGDLITSVSFFPHEVRIAVFVFLITISIVSAISMVLQAKLKSRQSDKLHTLPKPAENGTININTRTRTTPIIVRSDLDAKNTVRVDGCEMLKRKQEFINSKHGKHYGYASSARGHIDTWRGKEFPALIKPISLLNNPTSTESIINNDCSGDDDENDYENDCDADNDHDNDPEVYLDYAGSAIPSKSLLESMHKQSLGVNQILANPHSNGPSAARSKAKIEHCKKQVSDFFGANAGSMYGYGYERDSDDDQLLSDNDGRRRQRRPEEEYHPGYDIIFTSGTTQALQIVAENFEWDDGSIINIGGVVRRKQSILLYSHNSHTSVIGMREPAMGKGGSFRCENLDDISMATPKDFDMWANDTSSNPAGDVDDDAAEYAFVENENHIEANKAKHLLVFPLECNFGGTKSKARSIIKTSRMAQNGKWFSMLDVAKAASTSPINLQKLDPDFACVSFYKIFGAPTGIGALFVKRSSRYVIAPDVTDAGWSRKRRYFGGGAVDIALPREDFMRPRSSPLPLDALVHGTVNFRSIISLSSGLDEIQLFGMDAVSDTELGVLYSRRDYGIIKLTFCHPLLFRSQNMRKVLPSKQSYA